ncbi:PAAR-like protein [Paenibacillus sp. FSL L8-0340]|uniref:PAAR-like protein n=1 Tax=Paenibacillus sp. FSL L8-0340 TaxID=2954685 RepID=UPI003157F78C
MGIMDTLLTKSTLNKLLESPWRSEDTYVTAGAYMHCTRGTHEEVLNKQDPNGVYINGRPMLTVKDCALSTSEPGTIQGAIPFDRMGQALDGNFYSFGYCRSDMNPLKAAEKTLGFTDPSYMVDPDPEEPTTGQFIYPCAPKLMPTVLGPSSAGGPSPEPQFKLSGAVSALTTLLERLAGAQTEWTNGSPNVSIQGVQALTSKSCLFCQYGGQIRLLTNGMDPAPPEFSAR